jgi:Tfp pilus assembly protein PilN
VKPIHLNLAAKPYRDYRPYLAVMAIGSLLVALMALNNLDTWYRYQHDTKTTRDEIAALDRQTEVERTKLQTSQQRLRSINVALMKAQTQYVNSRLAERAFSWSELLDRLERVLPDDVRLISISPSFNKNGFVHLTLSCVGKTGRSMVTTIDNFNRDGHFARPFPTAEDNTGNGYAFGMAVDYRPNVARTVE